MKQTYVASTKQAGKGALEDFTNKWNHKYPYVVKSWKENYLMLFLLIFGIR